MGPMCGVYAFFLAKRSASNHAFLDNAVGLPLSWCPCTNIDLTLYTQEAMSSQAAMSESACSSVALIGLSLANLETTDSLSQAS